MIRSSLLLLVGLVGGASATLTNTTRQTLLADRLTNQSLLGSGGQCSALGRHCNQNNNNCTSSETGTVVRVAIGQKILIGYVARKLHAVFRTEQIWAPKICSIMVLNAMVSNMLGILERTTTVVLVSVAIGRSTVLVILRISVATAVSNESSP